MPQVTKPNTCGHDNRPHYARGMCAQCYRRWRYVNDSPPPEIATKINTCGHPDRPYYADGLCHPCYQRRLRNGSELIRVRGQRGRQNDICGHISPHYGLGMCEGCYKKWLVKSKHLRKKKHLIAFIAQDGTLYLSGDESPTDYQRGAGELLLSMIEIAGVRFWVGAAHTAEMVGTRQQAGRWYRLYPQDETPH